MEIIPPDPPALALAGAVACEAVSHAVEAAELLDVDVDQLAWMLTLVAPHGLRWFQQGWLERNRDGPISGFAKGVRRDRAAVEAALTLPWSTGPVEGQVNRLKLVKRQGYGRANLDLLRARLLAA